MNIRIPLTFLKMHFLTNEIATPFLKITLFT